MKLLVYSDLHIDVCPLVVPQRAIKEADLIVLAGDICPGVRSVQWAQEAFAGKPVVFVIGNHELYGGNVSRTSIEIKKATKGSNVHVLDSEAVVIDGVRFIGTTFWTDFKLFGSSMAELGTALHVAKNCMADFSCITHGTTGWMTPAQSVHLHRVAKAWLQEEIERSVFHAGPTVVVTHHAPAWGSLAPRWAKDPVSPAFVSRCEDLVAKAEGLWIHGHTHQAFDYTIDKCRVVCNPRGYKTKDGGGEVTGFDSHLLVDLEATR